MANPNDKSPGGAGHTDENEIIVNSRPKKWAEPTISFEQLVQLAFPDAQANPNRIYTVTYKKGAEQGSLVAGGTVNVKSGMIFNVAATDRS